MWRKRCTVGVAPPLADGVDQGSPLVGVRLPLSSVELAPHGLAVEPGRLELAHDHADVLLAEVLLAVTRNRDDDTGVMAKTPMARSLAAEFSKAVIRQPGRERSSGHGAHAGGWDER